MLADDVNLNKARKAKVRAVEKRQAVEILQAAEYRFRQLPEFVAVTL